MIHDEEDVDDNEGEDGQIERRSWDAMMKNQILNVRIPMISISELNMPMECRRNSKPHTLG